MPVQAALAKEKSERARIVLSLRDTITGLKQAGDVEGRLKADLVNTHDQLAASQVARVCLHSPVLFSANLTAHQLSHGKQKLLHHLHQH